MRDESEKKKNKQRIVENKPEKKHILPYMQFSLSLVLLVYSITGKRNFSSQ